MGAVASSTRGAVLPPPVQAEPCTFRDVLGMEVRERSTGLAWLSGGYAVYEEVNWMIMTRKWHILFHLTVLNVNLVLIHVIWLLLICVNI